MDIKTIQNFIRSKGWKIITDEIDLRIKDIEEVLLTPIADIDKLTKSWMTAEEKVNFIDQKQKEREYLKWVKGIPQELLDSQVQISES